MKGEFVYWMALSQIKNWGIERINQIIIKAIYEQNKLLSEFFSYSTTEIRNRLGLTEKEIIALEEVKKELPKYSFLTEDLLSQGYQIITIDSPNYSKTLRDNLKIKYSPPLIYVKGNIQLLQENSIAIVGSRDADDISLKFTDNIAKQASKDFKVVVSGFAKGVDKQALDSTIKYKGQSIIVLPQGIMTFGSGFNKYYKEIQSGDVLVLSTFFPKSPWGAQLAMARNPIIYGLAKEIYVAQSSDKGGTWSGVLDGLRKGREIFVRLPESYEKNANNLLIDKRAKAVDNNGDIIAIHAIEKLEFVETQQLVYASKPKFKETQELSLNELDKVANSLEDQIINLLTNSVLSSNDIIHALNLDWGTAKMTNYLKKMPNIKTNKVRNTLKFTFMQEQQNSLFGN